MNTLPIGRPRRKNLASKLLPLLIVLAFVGLACATVQNPDGWAPPTIVDDVLYLTPDNGEIAAVNLGDLSDLSNLDARVAPKWLFPDTNDELCGNEPKPKKRDLRGIYGTPQVDDANVYIGGYDGNVYALDRDDGSCAWVFEAGEHIIGGTALVDSKLYFGSDDSILHVLDVTDGSEVVRGFDAGAPIWVTPLVTDDAIYVSTVSGDLFALNPDTLEEIWAEPFSVDGGLITDPVLADETTLLVGGLGETLYAVDVTNGAEKWSLPGSNWFWGRPLVADGTIYVPDLDGNVYALDLGGRPVWQAPFQAENSVRSAPLLVNGTLIIVDTKGNLYGVDPDNGFALWPAPAVLGKTVHSDPILFGDTILVVARGGDLFQVDLESRGFLKIKVRR